MSERRIRALMLAAPVAVVLALQPCINDKAELVFKPATENALAPHDGSLAFLEQIFAIRRAEAAALALPHPAIEDLPVIEAEPRHPDLVPDSDLIAALPIIPASLATPAENTVADKASLTEIASIEDAPARKQAFVDLILPEIQLANAAIIEDRSRLERIRDMISRGEAPSTEEAAWIDTLTDAYKARDRSIEDLLERVDLIPASLALSQAALESGWGTSRLARKGLALFGQTDGGDGFARFKSLSGGIAAYFRNLNTHPAYAEFRRARASARAEGIDIDGYALAGHLEEYSELGENYIEKVRAVMTTNDFHLISQVSLSR